MHEIISIKNMRFDYGANKDPEGGLSIGRSHFTISIPEFHISAGERVMLLGKSGSGKSTFLNLISGVLRAQEGSINLLGQDLTCLSAAQGDKCRGDHIGLIYQTLNLVPWLTAYENIALGVAFSQTRKLRITGSIEEAAAYLMDCLGVPFDVFANARAESLSVGQQQRIGAARALLGAPELIIADEPTSALDQANAEKFLDLVFDTMDDTSQSFLMVSHDERLAARFSRVVQFEGLVLGGTPL